MKHNLVIFFLLSLPLLVSAQKNNPTWTGVANGLVRDTALNYGLPSATLAIYKDSVLVSYQLSNNIGEFHFANLPIGTPLKIVATYMGYGSLTQTFSIDEISLKIDLKPLNLKRNANTLAEVEIRAIAPVRMNGDTLEFNAAAFKMDPNAVAEDLLRKLPGVIVWGDGTITVNGKEIKNFLVNGKPFFGGNTKVATQNIPKDAIDKVQVYRTNLDIDNPLDTITEVNLKLKKDKSFGYFGKIGSGYGTDKRFESDISLNIFSPNTQIGIVGASNNINKFAQDVSTMLRNSTFKGVGASIEYQPNFKASGVTKSNIGGFTFQRDFIPDPNNSKNNRVTANYFINNSDNFLLNNIHAKIALGEDATQLTNSIIDSKVSSTNQDFFAKYERKIKNIDYFLTAGLKINQNNIIKTQNDSVANSNFGLRSTRNVSSNYQVNLQRFAFKIHFNHSKSVENNNNALGNWSIDYSFDAGKENQQRLNQTSFHSFVSSSDNRYFNRVNDKFLDYLNQDIRVKLGDFYQFFFGQSVSGISMDIQNDLILNQENINNYVYDRASNNTLIPNVALSNIQNKKVVDERPSINISKSIFKQLSGRFQKSIMINVYMQGQIYQLKNQSDQEFQNFEYTYQKFIPKANLNYSHYKSGEFQNNIDLNYISFYNYPTVDQLYPIIDNSTIYNVQLGNPDLKPSQQHDLSLNFNHNSLRTKNTFTYTFAAKIGFIKDNFSYSVETDKNGGSTYSFLNLDGYKYVNFTGIISKAYKLKNNQLQFKLNSNLQFSKTPGFIKDFNQVSSVLNYSDDFNTNSNIQAYYSYKDLLAINVNQTLNTYHSKQTNLVNNVFNSSLMVTSIAADTRLTKKMSISSNIDYNISSFTGMPSNNFVIWNANFNYRFMKGNNLEAKLSALDILKQNRSIINFANNNVFRQTKVNALQQYFMVSIAYYPRKFGKK